MALDILKKAQEQKRAEIEKSEEEKRTSEQETISQRNISKQAFKDAVNYGISILEGAEVRYKILDLLDEQVELIAEVVGDEKALKIIEKHDFIFELSVKTPTGEPVEKVFTFAVKDLRTGAELVINEIAEIVKADYSAKVLDEISLSGKRVLKVTEDIHFGDFVKRESVGLEFSKEEIDKLAPFKVREFEKINYKGQENEITYKYNVISDPLGNEIMVFLIATADGLVAKLKKGTFSLIKDKDLTAIEFKLLKKVVSTLQESGIEIALEGKKAKDLGIWDEVDASTITNAGRLEKKSEYTELKIVKTDINTDNSAELSDTELDAIFKVNN